MLKNAVEAMIVPRTIGADRVDQLPRHGRVSVTLLVGLDHDVLASALGGLDAGC